MLVNYHKYNQNKYYYYKEMMVLVLFDAIIVLLNIYLHVFFWILFQKVCPRKEKSS